MMTKMKISIVDLFFLIVGASLWYYIYNLQQKNEELESIIYEQNQVLDTQRIYIKEVNKMIGINPYLYNSEQEPRNDKILL